MDNPIILNTQEATLRRLLLDVANHAHVTDNCERPVLRFAGGWVRDKLLGSTSPDIDVGIDNMTGARFGECLERYLKHHAHAEYPADVKLAKIKANPEKSKHLETAHTKLLGLEVDLVNLRKETYTQDSRNPIVEFGSPNEDALRRDATINALFYNLSTEMVEDFTKRGIQDLRSKLIKTPLSPLETFKDDPLRILRAIRFASRLRFQIDPGDKQAMTNHTIKEALIAKITRERVGIEVMKMLKGPNAQVALALLDGLSLYNSVFTTTDYGPVETSGWSRAYLTLHYISEADDLDEKHLSAKIIKKLLLRDADDTYLAWTMTCFIPWGRIAPRNTLGSTTKRVPSPASLAAKDGIKADNRITKLIDDAVFHLQDIIAQRSTNVQDETLTTSPLKRKFSTNLRVSQGQAIRRWGGQWRACVIFSLMTECSELPSDQDVQLLLRQYAAWLEKLQTLDLLDVDQLKPLASGDQIAAVFPRAKKGSWMKKALDIVVEWQLRNPGATDVEQAIEEVKHRARELFPP
ncbi:uncharacterized protein KY384_007608 [Bacidia gigantensis]|uniref:uncharacterized protein n=1 Tax=Bacidia gigantensis TaxID=2732470 RepID=UPI001D0375F0|nr:uncharacterized protein KY384_007608 [Bacidia gigantensis]KAG8527456.1 hypothetical protein KY384_007608 [Bacidia gigantensis]